MLGNNRISVLNEDHFSHLSELTILILRENKLSMSVLAVIIVIYVVMIDCQSQL